MNKSALKIFVTELTF